MEGEVHTEAQQAPGKNQLEEKKAKHRNKEDCCYLTSYTYL